MIFKPEMVEKILAGQKTVTRRPVKFKMELPPGAPAPVKVEQDCRYEVGETYAVQPGRGQKAVARIRILSVSRELLLALNTLDARREGFDGGPEFAAYWTKLYGSFDPTQLVHRIEFELVQPGEQAAQPNREEAG